MDSGQANDNSGFIGAGIVGAFILIVCGWYGSIWIGQKFRGKRTQDGASIEGHFETPR